MTDDRPWNAPKTEYVYLISAEGEWPVSAIADGHPGTPGRVEDEVKRRGQSAGYRMRVWRARITDLVELELVPAQWTKAELRVKQPSATREEPS